MTPVEQYFTNAFLTQYGAPNTIDPAAFVEAYEDALAGTDPELLKMAAKLVIKRQTFHAWPTVGECVAAVNHIAAERADAKARTTVHPIETKAPPTKESRERVAALLAETKANLAMAGKQSEKRRPEFDAWAQTSQPAWNERMRTSKTARWLSIPKELRELITGQKQ